MHKLTMFVIGAALALVVASMQTRAQGIDPGIAAIVAQLKAILTVSPVPDTVFGWTPFLDNAQSTAVTTVKGSAGELGAYHCLNPNTTSAYVQIFDTASTVTLGSTTPVLSLGLPASDGGNLEWGMGVHFANGIKVAVTTTATGNTAPSTAVDCNFAFK